MQALIVRQEAQQIPLYPGVQWYAEIMHVASLLILIKNIRII